MVLEIGGSYSLLWVFCCITELDVRQFYPGLGDADF